MKAKDYILFRGSIWIKTSLCQKILIIRVKNSPLKKNYIQLRGNVDVTDVPILLVGSCVPNTKRVSSSRKDRTAPVVVTEVTNGLVENCTANKVPCGGALIFLFHFKKLSDFESMIERYARNNERMITVAVGHNGELPANVKKNPLCI